MSDAAGDCFTFFHRLRVRWSECDPQGIVFNPNYLVYCDVALTEYFRAIGLIYPQDFAALDVDNFAVAASLTFRGSAEYDDELDIGVRTVRLGTTSFRIAFSVRRASEVLTEAEITYVIADRTTRRPRPLPERLIACILAVEKTMPDR